VVGGKEVCLRIDIGDASKGAYSQLRVADNMLVEMGEGDDSEIEL
jgi:hypothetical protein